MTPASPSKISEAFLAFVDPILSQLPEEAGKRVMTAVFRIGSLVWNAVVLDLVGHESSYLEQARDLARSGTSGLQREFTLALLADLEEHKRRENPPDLRLVGDFELFEGDGGELRLRMAAHEPPRPPARAT